MTDSIKNRNVSSAYELLQTLFEPLKQAVLGDSNPQSPSSDWHLPPNPETLVPRGLLSDWKYGGTRDVETSPLGMSRKEWKIPPRTSANLSTYEVWDVYQFPATSGEARLLKHRVGTPETFKAPSKNSLVRLELPRGLLTSEQLQDCVRTIQELNGFTENPILNVKMVLADNYIPGEDASLPEIQNLKYGYFEPSENTIYLNHSLFQTEHPYEQFKSVLVHEAGHARSHIGNVPEFSANPAWRLLSEAALVRSNYELFMDWHYDAENIVGGHPHDSPEELFASAYRAYYLDADKLLERIRNADSAEQMVFGIAVWCYLRDNVFVDASGQGKVFTKDEVDPFPNFKLEDYLGNLEANRSAMSDFSFGGPDRRAVEASLLLGEEWIPKLYWGTLSLEACLKIKEEWRFRPYRDNLENYFPTDGLQEAFLRNLLTLQHDDDRGKNLPQVLRLLRNPEESVRVQAAFLLTTQNWGRYQKSVHRALKAEFPKAEGNTKDMIGFYLTKDRSALELMELDTIFSTTSNDVSKRRGALDSQLTGSVEEMASRFDASTSLTLQISYIQAFSQMVSLAEFYNARNFEDPERETFYGERIQAYSQVLRDSIEHENYLVRHEAVNALYHHDSSSEREENAWALIRALQDPHPKIRLDALIILLSKDWGDLNTEVQAAARNLKDDEDPAIRESVEWWLNPDHL